MCRNYRCYYLITGCILLSNWNYTWIEVVTTIKVDKLTLNVHKQTVPVSWTDTARAGVFHSWLKAPACRRMVDMACLECSSPLQPRYIAIWYSNRFRSSVRINLHMITQVWHITPRSLGGGIKRWCWLGTSAVVTIYLTLIGALVVTHAMLRLSRTSGLSREQRGL